MTCQDLDDALFDLARGLALGPGSVAAVESHVEYCGTCAARLARERELTAGLRALAGSTAGEAGSPDLERRLVQAFGELHPAHAQASRVASRRGWFAAAAAAVVVTGAGALGVALLRGPDSPVPTSQRVADARGQTPAAAPPAGSPDATPQQADTRRPRTRNPAAEGPERGAMEGFVALPAAAGLPELESGRIIRIDLPVASLPAYGVDVIPDTRRTEVSADVLVGQDGQPRAIRLVTTTSNSRSRE
jgi:hypothetical protein